MGYQQMVPRCVSVIGRPWKHRGGRSTIAAAMVVGLCLQSPAVPAADDDEWPAEGFSVGRRGLPEHASAAWQSTVLIALNETPIGQNARIEPGMDWGSGLVLHTEPDASQPTGQAAFVVTNSHVVRCGSSGCRFSVGFNKNGSHLLAQWTRAVRIVADLPEKDLAFLKVAAPSKAVFQTPRLSFPAVGGETVEPLTAVGWPNLALRLSWGVRPPHNRDILVRRYSRGQVIRDIESYRLQDEAQDLRAHASTVLHNADILPGSSGGPLIDRRGRVIGINDRIVRPTGNGADLGYCCARADLHTPGRDCVHLAIASREILSEFNRIKNR